MLPSIEQQKIDLSASKLLSKHISSADAVGKMLYEAQEKGAVNEVRRLKFICDHYETLTPDTAYYWFDLEPLQREIEETQARKAEVWHTWRNRLSLGPLILTWMALALAVFFYQQDLNANPNDKTFPFLLLWQNGFNNHAPLSFPFTVTAALDVIFLAAYLFCLIKSQRIEKEAYDTATRFVKEHRVTVENLFQELNADTLPTITSSTDINEVTRVIRETINIVVEAGRKAVQEATEAFKQSVKESKEALQETQKTFQTGIDGSTQAIGEVKTTYETFVTISQMAIEEHKQASLQQLEETREASRQLIQTAQEAATHSLDETRESSLALIQSAKEISLTLIHEAKEASHQSLQEVLKATQETTAQVLYKVEKVVALALQDVTASANAIATNAEQFMSQIADESRQDIAAAEKRMDASDNRVQQLFAVYIVPMMEAFHQDVGTLHDELKRYQERLESLTSASQRLADASEVLVGNASVYMETGQAIEKQIGELSTTQQGVLAQITEVATGIRDSVIKMDGAVDGMKKAAEHMNTATEAIKGVTSGLSTGMVVAVDALMTGTKQATESLLTGVQEVTNTIHEQTGAMLNNTETTMNKANETMVNRVERTTISLNQAGNILRTASDQLQITTVELQKVSEKIEQVTNSAGFGGLFGAVLRRGTYRRKSTMR